ncbi:MAG: hypothetical protein R6U44_08125 [Archaeoglobaceae archaeon]
MDEDARSVKIRKRFDDRIRRLFYVLMLLFIVWIMYTIIIDWGGDLFALVSPILNGLVTIFLVLGVFSLIFYGRYGKIKTRNVLEVLVGISFFLTFFTIVIGYSLYRPFMLILFEEYLQGVGSFLPVVVFLMFFLSYLAGFLLILLQSFGLVSLIVLFQRKYVLKIFEDIKGLAGEEKRGSSLNMAYQSFLRWIFNIPKVLDTTEIKMENEKKAFQDGFPWKDFRIALFLEFILAVVLAIYISLNPLLLIERSLSELFALASAVSYFIPVIVIPLFIFRKLKVKIPGPAADFFLFEGARSKLLGIILALGTILLFLRLALRTFDPQLLVYSFLFYLAGFLVNSFFITFVYFDYFEDPLAEDLLDEFEEKT